MSERPTPRTAKAMMELPGRWNSIWVVPAEIACDLESELGDAIRERDEARDILRKLLEIIPQPECQDFEHTKEERHTSFKKCPVMERYHALIAQAEEETK